MERHGKGGGTVRHASLLVHPAQQHHCKHSPAPLRRIAEQRSGPPAPLPNHCHARAKQRSAAQRGAAHPPLSAPARCRVWAAPCPASSPPLSPLACPGPPAGCRLRPAARQRRARRRPTGGRRRRGGAPRGRRARLQQRGGWRGDAAQHDVRGAGSTAGRVMADTPGRPGGRA